jgi:hypothetical protein
MKWYENFTGVSVDSAMQQICFDVVKKKKVFTVT